MIKSSFKKIEKKGADTSAAYFGHPQLDAVLRNSLKKGHLITIEQDHPTTIYAGLLRYFLASNYHKSQHSLIFQSLTHEKWSAIIPEEIKQKATQKIQKNNEEKSEIAWRYDNMKINLNSLNINQNIPFLDLTKNVNQEKAKKFVKTYSYGELALKEFYSKIQQELMNTLSDSNDTALRKLVLTGLPERYLLDTNFQTFIHSLRCLVRTSHLLILITIRPLHPTEKDLLDTIISYSDYYMKINSDLGSAYSHFDGTLALIKEVQVGNVEMVERGITIWGMKTKNKKELRIEPLYQNTFEEEVPKEQHPCGITAKESLEF